MGGFFIKTLKMALKWSFSSGSLIYHLKVSLEDFFQEPIVTEMLKAGSLLIPFKRLLSFLKLLQISKILLETEDPNSNIS